MSWSRAGPPIAIVSTRKGGSLRRGADVMKKAGLRDRGRSDRRLDGAYTGRRGRARPPQSAAISSSSSSLMHRYRSGTELPAFNWGLTGWFGRLLSHKLDQVNPVPYRILRHVTAMTRNMISLDPIASASSRLLMPSERAMWECVAYNLWYLSQQASASGTSAGPVDHVNPLPTPLPAPRAAVPVTPGWRPISCSRSIIQLKCSRESV